MPVPTSGQFCRHATQWMRCAICRLEDGDPALMERLRTQRRLLGRSVDDRPVNSRDDQDGDRPW